MSILENDMITLAETHEQAQMWLNIANVPNWTNFETKVSNFDKMQNASRKI